MASVGSSNNDKNSSFQPAIFQRVSRSYEDYQDLGEGSEPCVVWDRVVMDDITADDNLNLHDTDSDYMSVFDC